jgi:phage terminase small subunit
MNNDEIEKQELELSPREEAFATAYTSIGSPAYSNATAAAAEAGYAEASARTQGWKLLQRPDVRRRIAEIHRQNMSRNYLTVDKVLSDLEHLRRKSEEKGDISTATRCVELQGKYLVMFSDRHTFETSEQPVHKPVDPKLKEKVQACIDDFYASKYLATSGQPKDNK